MKEDEVAQSGAELPGNPDDCGCEGNCCPPKKNNTLVKIIFTVTMMAAVGLMAVRFLQNPAPANVTEAPCCPPGSSAGCDTAVNAACDTVDVSSCCPEK